MYHLYIALCISFYLYFYQNMSYLYVSFKMHFIYILFLLQYFIENLQIHWKQSIVHWLCRFWSWHKYHLMISEHIICLPWYMCVVFTADDWGQASHLWSAVGNVCSGCHVDARPLVLQHPRHQEGLQWLDHWIHCTAEQTPVQHPKPVQHRSCS